VISKNSSEKIMTEPTRCMTMRSLEKFTNPFARRFGLPSLMNTKSFEYRPETQKYNKYDSMTKPRQRGTKERNAGCSAFQTPL
jgi:hypothetical protein